MAEKTRRPRPARARTRTGAASAIRRAIAEEHAKDPHPNLQGQALKVHLLLHEIVEKQLEEGQPPEAGAAMEALLARGVARHQAIHHLARAAARFAIGCMRSPNAPEWEQYRRQLAALALPQTAPGDPPP